MRLSHIEIENFKGIGTKQSIDLAPITLLFGPNSAGKSTILQALHYLREILERNNPDPDQTIAGGLTDLGGFATLVHNHDLSRPIRIKVRIDMRDDQGSERLPLNSGASLRDDRFNELGIRYLVGENTELRDYAVVQEVGVGIEVRWSDLINAPYVSRLDVEMDEEAICSVVSPAQVGRAMATDFNFEHSLMQPIRYPYDYPEEDERLGFVNVLSEDGELHKEKAISTDLLEAIWHNSREMSSVMEGRNEQELEGAADSSGWDTDVRVGIETALGALPEIDTPLALDFVDPDRELSIRTFFAGGSAADKIMDSTFGRSSRITRDENEAYEDALKHYKQQLDTIAGLSAIMDELILGPVRIVRDYLASVTYIGPLREIPSRGYRPRLSPDESRWAQGLAAWDVLYTHAGDQLLDSVNEWMSSDERLRTGYVLVKSEYKQISTTDGLHQLFKRGINEDDLGDLQELYEAIPSKSEISLMDVVHSIPVAPNDVGVGISQMVPVVVACLKEPKGLVAIEQPELHIHPAIQVGLGDLFITATRDERRATGAERTLLVETHSEHIMLRLLRRVREHSENELPPGALGLEPNDISVIYVEATERGPVFRRLRVSDNGDFVDNWPRGFFEERAEELF
ncbi:MAG TPA: AAA family ATPase [Rhizobium sp.]|nr:AAA family ATPase [Rhizobium sp.]